MTNYLSRNNLKEKEFILAYSANGIGVEVGWAWQQERGVGGCSCCACHQEKANKQEVGLSNKTSRFPSSIRAPLLKVLETSKTAPSAGHLAFKHLSLWGTFTFKQQHRSADGTSKWPSHRASETKVATVSCGGGNPSALEPQFPTALFQHTSSIQKTHGPFLSCQLERNRKASFSGYRLSFLIGTLFSTVCFFFSLNASCQTNSNKCWQGCWWRESFTQCWWGRKLTQALWNSV